MFVLSAGTSSPRLCFREIDMIYRWEYSKAPPQPAARLKVRRRRNTLSSLQSPTSYFLAAVTSTDTPIPTIEEAAQVSS